MFKQLALVLLTLFLISSAFALTVDNINAINDLPSQQQIAQMKADLTAKMDLINQRLDKIPDNNRMEIYLGTLNQLTITNLENFRSATTVNFIFVGIGIAGLMAGAFAYFKAQGRL